MRADVREPDLARAVNLVFLPEGYTAGRLGDFRAHALDLLTGLDAHAGTIVGRDPTRFNRYVVDIASPTDAVTNASPTDTPLHGCLAADALGVSERPMLRVHPELALFAARNAVPAADLVVVIVNTSSGRANAPLQIEPLVRTGMVVLSLVSDFTVLDHEIGHALVHLGDEYTETEQCFPAMALGAPTVASPGDWSNTLEFTPNLSTDPAGGRWQADVRGAVEGGARYRRCVFHPTGRCRMRDESEPYCAVCSAAIDRELLRVRTGLDRTPPACGMYLAAHTAERWVVCPRAVARFGPAGFAIRGIQGEVLLAGVHETLPASVQPGLGGLSLGRGCATIDTTAWAEGPHRVTIECTNAFGTRASNTLTLDVRRGH